MRVEKRSLRAQPLTQTQLSQHLFMLLLPLASCWVHQSTLLCPFSQTWKRSYTVRCLLVVNAQESEATRKSIADSCPSVFYLLSCSLCILFFFQVHSFSKSQCLGLSNPQHYFPFLWFQPQPLNFKTYPIYKCFFMWHCATLWEVKQVSSKHIVNILKNDVSILAHHDPSHVLVFDLKQWHHLRSN